MIIVDTSVWVAGFRGDAEIVPELSRVLDQDLAAVASPIRIELLSGSRASELGRLKLVLSALPTFVPSSETWRITEGWVTAAARADERFGVADLLIAAVAKAERASIWSLDSDFERMARLRFVSLHRPSRARR